MKEGLIAAGPIRTVRIILMQIALRNWKEKNSRQTWMSWEQNSRNWLSPRNMPSLWSQRQQRIGKKQRRTVLWVILEIRNEHKNDEQKNAVTGKHLVQRHRLHECLHIWVCALANLYPQKHMVLQQNGVVTSYASGVIIGCGFKTRQNHCEGNMQRFILCFPIPLLLQNWGHMSSQINVRKSLNWVSEHIRTDITIRPEAALYCPKYYHQVISW